MSLFDSIDSLELALKFSKGLSIQVVSRLVNWFEQKKGDETVSYYKTALEEPAFKNRSAQFIVHGHTHHHEIVALDSTLVKGKPLNQMYLNSGTWRRVHELAKINPEEGKFMGYHVMTYFAFFKDGERRGRPFETWSGALGI